MKTLITGGAGFIGSHLAEKLLRDGHSVTIIDDLSTGTVQNISHLMDHPRFRCVISSIQDRPVMRRLVESSESIVHLAAAVGVRLIVESPVRTIHTNVLGTEILLELASRRSTPVLIASTSEVYGKSNKIPFCEEDDIVLGPPTKTRWSYACSKALDECLGLAYWTEQKLPVTIVRLFNTVGPRQTGRYGMVLPTFVRQALAGEPLTVFGDGSQSRCFTYVGDVVWALARLLRQPAAAGEVFNIGNTQEVTIADLAARVRQMTQSRSPIVQVSYENAYGDDFEDMLRRVPDIRKIAASIGFAPQHDLTAIIQSVIDFVRTERPKARPMNHLESKMIQTGLA